MYYKYIYFKPIFDLKSMYVLFYLIFVSTYFMNPIWVDGCGFVTRNQDKVRPTEVKTF